MSAAQLCVTFDCVFIKNHRSSYANIFISQRLRYSIFKWFLLLSVSISIYSIICCLISYGNEIVGDAENTWVKETLQKLQDSCKNKTIAESKMRLDLIELKTKTNNLKVLLVDTSSKVNYYNSQMKVQTEKVKKITKPFYLDPNKSRFIKTNLSSTNQNIEDLVRQVKVLKAKTTEIADVEALEDISKLSISKNQSGIV